MFKSKYNLEDKKKWLEDFKKSTKSAAGYAKAIGVPETTFRMWIHENENKQYNNTFGEITLAENTIITSQEKKEVIIFQGRKIKIELEQGYSKETLKKIIEVLIND